MFYQIFLCESALKENSLFAEYIRATSYLNCWGDAWGTVKATGKAYYAIKEAARSQGETQVCQG